MTLATSTTSVTPDSDDLVLVRLPNGELAWLKPEIGEDADPRYVLTDQGRHDLYAAELFGCEEGTICMQNSVMRPRTPQPPDLQLAQRCLRECDAAIEAYYGRSTSDMDGRMQDLERSAEALVNGFKVMLAVMEYQLGLRG